MPTLKHNSLISGPQFSNLNYVIILTPTEVLIYDNDNVKISVSKYTIIRGWCNKLSGMWHLPLQAQVPPTESKYILLKKPSEESITNVCNLSSTKQIVKYL